MTGHRQAGFAVSLAVHLAIAAAVIVIPFEMMTYRKSIVLDFSIVRGPGAARGGGGEKHGSAGIDKKSAPRKVAVSRNPGSAAVDPLNNERPTTVLDRGLDRKELTASDPQGEVTVAGENTSVRHAVSTGSAGAPSGTGGAGVKTLNYLGSGGEEERNFSFIRDRIMQSIVYPRRARRMGWEGKVTLSFTVLENGSIDDVKVVGSSGFSVLDESARESVAKTNLRRKVPVRLVVLLPVEYRLR